MESNSYPSQKQLLEKLCQVAEKSLDTNIKYVQDVSELFDGFARRRLDLTDENNGSLLTLNQALMEYVFSSATYASQLLDLGMEVTEELLGNFGERRQNNNAKEQPRAQVFDLEISGRPGSHCQTAFVLNNNQSQPIRAKINYSMLVDSAGEHALNVPIQFNPSMVKLENQGDKKRVIVGIELPPNLNPGLYHTTLTIEGMPGLQYRLLVRVEELFFEKVGVPKQQPSQKWISKAKKKSEVKKRKPLTRK